MHNDAHQALYLPLNSMAGAMPSPVPASSKGADDNSKASVEPKDFPKARPYFYGIGRGRQLGSVSRAPPLSALEFSTSLADGLETHSLEGLKRVLAAAAASNKGHLLVWAVRAQALRKIVTSACIRHNQVRPVRSCFDHLMFCALPVVPQSMTRGRTWDRL